jgi:alpha-methylacyl-CoA racemase
MSGRSGPLAGVRVLDLTRFPPGAYCTSLLADLGADVCRVQPPVAGGGFVSVGLARNKRSVAVDLRHERGNEVLRRLAGWADVLVEAERPGAMDERGFGYAAASSELPSLIWCSISGYGQDGPLARSSGHDLSYVAHSGLLAAIDPKLPWYPQTILSIPTASLLAAVGIVSALRERDRTGEGCQLDISMSEAATWVLSGTDGELNGNPYGIPGGPDRHLYECADGRWVALASAEPRTWAALCAALEVDDLRDTLHGWDDPEAVVARLAKIFRGRPADDWVAELVPRGVAIVRANRGDELQHDPHAAARGTLEQVGDVVVPRNPIRIRDATGERSSAPSAPPVLADANTRDVLAEAGLSAEEIEELAATGAVGAS